MGPQVSLNVEVESRSLSERDLKTLCSWHRRWRKGLEAMKASVFWKLEKAWRQFSFRVFRRNANKSKTFRAVRQ